MSGEKIDIFKRHKAEYKAGKKPALVQTTRGMYLAVDGQGAPGSDSYLAAIAALYGMAYTMIGLPSKLFTTAASTVFYVEAGDRVIHGHSATPPTKQLVRMLSVLIPFPLAVVLVLGPFVFEVFLGSRWHEAGVYAQILVPWVALVAFSSAAAGKTFLVTDGHWYSTHEMCCQIRAALGQGPARWHVPDGALKTAAVLGDRLRKLGLPFPFDRTVYHKMLGSACYSSRAFEKELGFRPEYTLDKSLPGMII